MVGSACFNQGLPSSCVCRTVITAQEASLSMAEAANSMCRRKRCQKLAKPGSVHRVVVYTTPWLGQLETERCTQSCLCCICLSFHTCDANKMHNCITYFTTRFDMCTACLKICSRGVCTPYSNLCAAGTSRPAGDGANSTSCQD